jgi:hypothetical protein
MACDGCRAGFERGFVDIAEVLAVPVECRCRRPSSCFASSNRCECTSCVNERFLWQIIRDEAAAMIEVGTVFEGNVPDVAFGVTEAEAASPAGLFRLLVQVCDVVEIADQFVSLEDPCASSQLIDNAKPRKPSAGAAKLPVEDRFGKQPEYDAIRALEHDVLGHARRGLRPSELPVKRRHAPDVSARERDGADPHWKTHKSTSLRPRGRVTFPNVWPYVSPIPRVGTPRCSSVRRRRHSRVRDWRFRQPVGRAPGLVPDRAATGRVADR